MLSLDYQASIRRLRGERNNQESQVLAFQRYPNWWQMLRDLNAMIGKMFNNIDWDIMQSFNNLMFLWSLKCRLSAANINRFHWHGFSLSYVHGQYMRCEQKMLQFEGISLQLNRTCSNHGTRWHKENIHKRRYLINTFYNACVHLTVFPNNCEFLALKRKHCIKPTKPYPSQHAIQYHQNPFSFCAACKKVVRCKPERQKGHNTLIHE